jgi:coproporphyrinogen III oxidase-like Fe-S oxidoreductase
VDAYLNSLLEQRQRPPRDAYRLGSDDQAREVLWLGVRQAAGVAWERLAELISPGVLAAVQRKARFLAAQGYLDVGREGTRLRPEAYYVADNVCLELLRAMAGGSA